VKGTTEREVDTPKGQTRGKRLDEVSRKPPFPSQLTKSYRTYQGKNHPRINRVKNLLKGELGKRKNERKRSIRLTEGDLRNIDDWKRNYRRRLRKSDFAEGASSNPGN